MTSPQDPENPFSAPEPGSKPPQYPGGAMPPSREQYVPAAQQRPKQVETSFKLWLLYVALGVLSAVISFFVFDKLIDQALEERGLRVGPEGRDTVQGVVILSIVLRLALLAGVAAVAFQMRNGKNWARITLTVLGAIVLILSLIGIADRFNLSGIGAVLGVIDIVQLLVLVGALVLMFVKDANPFFASRQNQY